METLKPRAKITVILDKNKAIFSGRKRDAQIATVGENTEVRANKLSDGFRFRADGYRPQELSNADIIALNYKVTLIKK